MRFKDKLDKKTYLADFSKILVSFGIRQIRSPLFAARIENMITREIESLDAKSTENLLYFFVNTQ